MRITKRRDQLPAYCPATVILLMGLASLTAVARPPQASTTDLRKQAQADEDRQDYAAAEGIYRQLLASHPDDLEILERLGIIEQTNLKFGDSIEHFQRVLRKDRRYPQVNFFLGLSYYGKRDLRDAAASFQNELQTPAPHPATRYYLALTLEAEGRMNEAIDQLNQLAAHYPDKPEVLFELARLHMDASFQDFARLRKLDPDSFQIHAFMGSLYSQEGNYDAAVAQYQAALKKQPDALGVHSPLGVDYFMLHQPEAAQKELLRAVQEAPDDPLANLYLGDITLRQQQFNKALPYLQRAAVGRPKDVESHLLLGRCLIGLGNLEQARTELLLTATLDAADPRPHYVLAEVYQKLGRPADRQRELDVFNKLDGAQRARRADGRGSPPEPGRGNAPQ